MGADPPRAPPRVSSWTSRYGRKDAISASIASGGASLMSARPGRLRCTERATASRYIRGERVTSTRIMEPAYQSRVRTQRLREKMARSVHGQGLRTAALRAELRRTPSRNCLKRGSRDAPGGYLARVLGPKRAEWDGLGALWARVSGTSETFQTVS